MYLKFHAFIATVKMSTGFCIAIEMNIMANWDKLHASGLIPEDTGKWLSEMTNRIIQLFHAKIYENGNDLFSIPIFARDIEAATIFANYWKKETIAELYKMIKPDEIIDFDSITLFDLLSDEIFSIEIHSVSHGANLDLFNCKKIDTISLHLRNKPAEDFEINSNKGEKWQYTKE